MPSQQLQQASPAQQPQQQPQGMPPQNDPRMSAAMDVVESNIPEYLNPTDALMKRNQAAELAQQAMALMASADRQTAMSQQPPTPPTIAEQVDQRAMEGISGIAQRLAPGMQQRGQQIQKAQARKMLSGGMPSMGAPNMARMADGGIVGYAEGDLVKQAQLTPMQIGQQKFNHRMFQKELDDYNMLKGLETKYSEESNNEGLEKVRLGLEKYKGGRAEEQYMLEQQNKAESKGMASGGIVGYQQGGDVSAPPVPTPGVVPKSAVGDAQIKQFAAEYMAIKGSIDNAQTPEGKMQAQQLLQDLRAQMGNEQGAVMQYIDSTQGSIAAPGMARGGIIGYQQGGKIDEELLALVKPPKGDEVFRPSYPSRDDRIAERERNEAVRAANRANQNEEYNLRRQLAALDIDRAGQDVYIEAQKAKRKGALGDFSGLGSLRAPESFRMQGMEEVEKETPKGTQYDPTGTKSAGLRSGAAQDTPAQDSVNDIISRIADVEYREVPSSALRVPIEDAGLGNISRNPEAERLAEESRKQTQAEAVYAMSPEMKAAYAADRTKRDEYYTAQLDPKRQRDQKINALLAGLATPGGIAKSGIAALQGTTAVDDTALEMQRRRAEEDFASTKEQAGIEREGRVNAFDASTTAGQSAFERASAAVNQASQSLSQLASSEETREQAMAIQQYTIETGNLQLQLDELVRQQNLAEADKTRMRYIVADLQDAQRDIDSNISNLQNSMLLVTEPAEKAAALRLIEAEKVRKAGMQRQIDETFRRIGFPTAGSPPSGSRATGTTGDPETDKLLDQYAPVN